MSTEEGGAVEGASGWGEDMNEEINDLKPMKMDKRSDTVVERDVVNEDRPEDDCFEFEEEIQEEEIAKFLSVKPWIGAVKEPDNHPEVNTEKPDETMQLEYVYGYRCQDSRQNVYFNPDGNIVYMTACLGVMLNISDNTQLFFGGGEVANESKQVSSDQNHHSNDIMCLKVNVNGDRNWAVSGQVGKSPAVFVWNTATGEKRQRIKLNRNSRQVTACAISKDGSKIATADGSNDHIVSIWDVDSGSMEFSDKGSPDPIFDLCFTQKDGDYTLWSAGIKDHMAVYTSEKGKKKCLFGSNPRTSMVCCTADDQGRCYSGAANALIYVWNGQQCVKTMGFHGKGFVGAINWVDGKLYSGGKDGRVCIINPETFECENAFQFPALPRALDAQGSNIIVGLRTGSIVKLDTESGNMETVQQSHNSGEVWGLDTDDALVYTTGDDN
jgi:WD40 repeat protein